MYDKVPCEKVFNNCWWCGLRFLCGKKAQVSNSYLCKNIYSQCPTQISFQLIQQPVYLGLVYFTGPLYLQMGTGLMTHLAFASPFAPLPLPHKFKVLSPWLYRRQSKEFQNRRVYRDGNMAVKSLSDKHNIIFLILYFISEVWGKWQYEVFVTSKKSVLVGTYFL